MLILKGDIVKVNVKKLSRDLRRDMEQQHVNLRKRGKVRSLHTCQNKLVDVAVRLSTKIHKNVLTDWYFEADEIENGVLTVIRKKKNHPLTKIFRD